MSTRGQLTREQEASFKRIVGRAVLVPIAVMLVASILLAWLVSHLLSVTNWLDHTDQVIAKARNSERLIMDMQTALRGNLLTGSPQLLDSFNHIADQIPPALDDLAREVSDNPPQVSHEKTLRADYDQWGAYARELLAHHEHKQDYARMPANTQEMALMNRIHSDFDRFVEVENDLRKQRNLEVETIDRLIRSSRLLVLVGLGLGIGLYVRHQLRATARLYEQALTVAEQKSEELRVSEASLREAQAKLRTHAEDLEKTVAERTAQLRETVGQLESYSYSVS
ncbi:MAG TPA: CHASE3 domain-containing protein, partial [Verrucomicrobiae bacterium]|nr:CHASE3 domain-containing protein [Verrucomicrobiae bacterium]